MSGRALAHLMLAATAAWPGAAGVVDWGELVLCETPGDLGAVREIGLSFFARWRSEVG